MHDNEGKPYLMLRTAVAICSTKSEAAPTASSGDSLVSSTGSVCRDELRETLRLFDIFRDSAPMKDLAEELNQRVAIYRSELATRDSIAKAQNVVFSDCGEKVKPKE